MGERPVDDLGKRASAGGLDGETLIAGVKPDAIGDK